MLLPVVELEPDVELPPAFPVVLPVVAVLPQLQVPTEFTVAVGVPLPTGRLVSLERKEELRSYQL